MQMQIELPNGLDLSHFEVAMNLAAKLFERGLVSSGQAAKIVGVSKKTFLETVGAYGVTVFQYDEEELEDELNSL